ncbi:MAG: cation:proton antiporter [Thermoplasmata archaeon]
MLDPDILFLAIAGIAFLGFAFDAIFHRLRVASILPLMLLGALLVVSGILPAGTVGLLNSLIPYVSALTVAFILFAVGLEIRFSDLFRVLGRATAFTFGVQATSGIVIALAAFEIVHWSLLISFIFGFALSGPSSIAVPVLVRVARMPEGLRTSLLYESVVSDVLQLLVPITMIGFLAAGTVSLASIASSLLWTVLGSAGGGALAAIVWLWLLDRLRNYAKGYTWTLTITMVLASYGIADRLGLSAAITIFVFGLILGNAQLLDFRRGKAGPLPTNSVGLRMHDLRERLGISTRGLDIGHILQVQREVSFFASSFFFVYIGLLFQVGAITPSLVIVAALAAFLMLGARAIFVPILNTYYSEEPAQRRAERGLVMFNISRGLAAAVVATVPQTRGIVIPGFIDAIFLGILLSTVVSTIGIFAVYRPSRTLADVEPVDLVASLPFVRITTPTPPTPESTSPDPEASADGAGAAPRARPPLPAGTRPPPPRGEPPDPVVERPKT